MRIKVISPNGFRHGRDEYVNGDERTVPDHLGTYFCNAGWAEDLDGKVKTAPRDVNRVVLLEVETAKHYASLLKNPLEVGK